METKQKNYLDMFNAVYLFYEDNKTFLDLVLARANGFAFVKSQIQLIGQASGKQSLPGTGITLDKAAARELLDQTSFTIMSSVAAYAKSINDNTLFAQLNYSFTAIQDIQDESIADWAKERLDLCSPLMPLADYDLDTTTISDWQDIIDAYRPHTATQRNYVVQRSGHTLNIDMLTKETVDFLKNTLDKLMNATRFSQPIVFNDYKKARVIVDLGKGHDSSSEPTTPPTEPTGITVVVNLSGTVTNSATFDPMPNITVTVANELGQLTTTTDENGHYDFEFDVHLDSSEDTLDANVTAEEPGFAPNSQPFQVTSENVTFTIDLPLTPTAP